LKKVLHNQNKSVSLQHRNKQKNNKMNSQDLTNSKNGILIRINEIADTTKTREIMVAMLNLVNGGMNETNNPIELVDEVVKLMGYEKKIIARDAAELMHENMMKNLHSSLR
jgi:hypothetical protein